MHVPLGIPFEEAFTDDPVRDRAAEEARLREQQRAKAPAPGVGGGASAVPDPWDDGAPGAPLGFVPFNAWIAAELNNVRLAYQRFAARFAAARAAAPPGGPSPLSGSGDPWGDNAAPWPPPKSSSPQQGASAPTAPPPFQAAPRRPPPPPPSHPPPAERPPCDESGPPPADSKGWKARPEAKAQNIPPPPAKATAPSARQGRIHLRFRRHWY